MHEISNIREQANSLFADIRRITQGNQELLLLRKLIISEKDMLDQPMRVALIGPVSSGKSTLLNAIFGKELIATGVLELTSQVSWCKYGKQESLVVHTGKQSFEREFSSLAELSSLCQQDDAFIESIDYIEVFCNNPLLKIFEIIDTPGLDGKHPKASEKTIKFLTTSKHKPHAIIYLTVKAFQDHNLSVLESFNAASGNIVSGITAVACLSRADALPKKFESAETVITSSLNHARIRRAFYRIIPLAPLTAYAAKSMSEDDFSTLRELSILPVPRLSNLLVTKAAFCSTEYEDEGIPPCSKRISVYNKLQKTGILEACQWLRVEDLNKRTLCNRLLQYSRVPELLKIITSHYGNRADIIKLQSFLSSLDGFCVSLFSTVSAQSKGDIAKIRDQTSKCWGLLHELEEYKTLKQYYEGEIDFDAEELNSVLQVTGEFGMSVSQRLGLPEDSRSDLYESAAKDQWRKWEEIRNRPFTSPGFRDAAAIISKSYHQIYTSLNKQ